MKPESNTPYNAATGPLTSNALLALASLLLACGGLALAQEPQTQEPSSAQQRPAQRRDDAAPPPLRYLPEETRARLAAAKDLKARAKLSLELADERITRAAEHLSADRFEAATSELGIYEAIVRDAVTNVQRSSTAKNRQRDIFKRLEMALRAHMPRVETIRRGLPAAHAYNAQATLDFIRDLRAEALNAFYDDTVIPEVPKGTPRDNERAKGTAPVNEKKP